MNHSPRWHGDPLLGVSCQGLTGKQGGLTRIKSEFVFWAIYTCGLEFPGIKSSSLALLFSRSQELRDLFVFMAQSHGDCGQDLGGLEVGHYIKALTCSSTTLGACWMVAQLTGFLVCYP